MTIKVGLVGLGFMGNGHLRNYLRLQEEGVDVKLVAICDVDPKKRKGALVAGNLPVGVAGDVDFSQFNFYADMADMIAHEDLDYVDLVTPTYTHSPLAVQAMHLGVNVLSEKPMAISSADCAKMIAAAEETGKKVMVAQCLRFHPAYAYVKAAVDSGRYGSAVNASFYRGGTTPRWSWNNWMMQKELAGGCLLDQHIHDVDTINWLFGIPAKVATIGQNVIETSGYDAVSTNYIYPTGGVIQASDNWTINSDDYGFEMRFRVDFEHGSIRYENGKVTDFPYGAASFEPELDANDGYYNEIRFFIDCVQNDRDPQDRLPLSSTMATIQIAEAEVRSADDGGAVAAVTL
ncbi:Gfo/Idh/MocA family protein [Lacticaseibacillus suihuaensis]